VIVVYFRATGGKIVHTQHVLALMGPSYIADLARRVSLAYGASEYRVGNGGWQSIGSRRTPSSDN
jgi:hypothetical protein